MITYSNIQRYDNMDFGDYLNLPGLSHSFLKKEVNGVTAAFDKTPAMELGSLVDGILTSPKSVDFKHELYDAAKNIASKIKSRFGEVIESFEKQSSFTANMEFSGFMMPSKGRLDYLLPKHAIIDLKVTSSKDIPSLISFMGYDNQLWHYARLAGVRRAYLMVYSKPLKDTSIISCDVTDQNNAFWESKILKFGKVK